MRRKPLGQVLLGDKHLYEKQLIEAELRIVD
jgi:hypothetical protein